MTVVGNGNGHFKLLKKAFLEISTVTWNIDNMFVTSKHTIILLSPWVRMMIHVLM